MAERSGREAIDSLIEAYLIRNEWTDTDWGDGGSLDGMRNPQTAQEMCGVITHDFIEFAHQFGIEAYNLQDQMLEAAGKALEAKDETQARLFEKRIMGSWLYPGSQGASECPHTAAVIVDENDQICVDFTASQFGVSDFPCVLQLDESADIWVEPRPALARSLTDPAKSPANDPPLEL